MAFAQMGELGSTPGASGASSVQTTPTISTTASPAISPFPQRREEMIHEVLPHFDSPEEEHTTPAVRDELIDLKDDDHGNVGDEPPIAPHSEDESSSAVLPAAATSPPPSEDIQRRTEDTTGSESDEQVGSLQFTSPLFLCLHRYTINLTTQPKFQRHKRIQTDILLLRHPLVTLRLITIPPANITPTQIHLQAERQPTAPLIHKYTIPYIQTRTQHIQRMQHTP